MKETTFDKLIIFFLLRFVIKEILFVFTNKYEKRLRLIGKSSNGGWQQASLCLKTQTEKKILCTK